MKAEVRRVFGKDANDALRIFTCESGLNPRTIGDSSLPSTLAYKRAGLPYGSSIGIAQIRLLPGRPEQEWLKDVYNNISYSKKLFDKQGFQPWTCAHTLGIVK